MPTVARSRSLPVPPDSAWRLLADPDNLPRWWPGTVRVESVEGEAGARRSRFTQVMETQRGVPVRADWRITASTRGERLVWEQRLEDTPFEKFMRSSELEIRIDPEQSGVKVTLEGRRRLRGLSRLGAPMMSRATKQLLERVLDRIELALVGDREGTSA